MGRVPEGGDGEGNGPAVMEDVFESRRYARCPRCILSQACTCKRRELAQRQPLIPEDKQPLHTNPQSSFP